MPGKQKEDLQSGSKSVQPLAFLAEPACILIVTWSTLLRWRCIAK